MKTASPLRYPGGKSSMTSVLAQVRRLNRLGNRAVAEPFAGGAGASLALLFDEMTHEIYINDLDFSIRDFWWSVTQKSDNFIALLESCPISMDEWRKQRDIYRSKERISRLKRGFATFYLNRCNRSGVIFNAGPIGGVEQIGKWKIDARFNRKDLIARCRKVAEYRDRVVVSGSDGVQFIKSMDAARTFFFIDPPYFEKGQSLYLNVADSSYHAVLANHLRGMTESAWVLTYDDCAEIRNLYDGWANIRPFSLRYSAAERRGGREVLITPKWMKLPDSQLSEAIGW